MGSGGDGYCDVCRSRKCTCPEEADGEVFPSQRWAQASVANRWPDGSVVVVKYARLTYDIISNWRAGQAIDGCEYLLIKRAEVKPKFPSLPKEYDDIKCGTSEKYGSPLYEIYSEGGRIHLRRTHVCYLCRPSLRIVCGFDIRTGVNPKALGQFNQTYRNCYERGNHLHMYRTITTEKMLEVDFGKFRMRYAKRTGRPLRTIAMLCDLMKTI